MLKQTDGIRYASSPILESVDFISHGFLSRTGGISKPPFHFLNFDIRDGDAVEKVRQNKAMAGNLFGFDAAKLATVKQVHGNDVFVINKPLADLSEVSQTPADVIITNQHSIAIGVLTADCVPIMLLDPAQKIIGVVHAGWRGTAKTAAQKAVTAMAKEFGSEQKNIVAAIGPSIGPCCYEVDDAVAKEFSYDTAYMEKEGSGWRLDLKKANLHQMLRMGLSENNISMENLCTSCKNDIFFSYRGDGKITGRQLNFIVLKGS